MEEKPFAGVGGLRMSLILAVLKSLGESRPSEDIQETAGHGNLEFKEHT